MWPGWIDKKCHPGGLLETDILLSLALSNAPTVWNLISNKIGH